MKGIFFFEAGVKVINLSIYKHAKITEFWLADNSVVEHQCNFNVVILDYDLLKDNGSFFKPKVSSETMTIKYLNGNFEKKFSRVQKSGFSKGLAAIPQRKVFMFILLIIISNYKAACPVSATWKTHLCK